jgi:uncharacterized membrane protein
MQVPLHPMLVHLPLALTFVLPFLIVIFAFLIKMNKMTPKGWLIIIGLQLTVVLTGYISLETGKNEEQAVSKVLDRKLIHAHEEAAKIFVGSTVLALVLSIGVYFISKEYCLPVRMIIALVTLTSCFLAYRTALQGGELVYVHGAANAYILEGGEEIQGLLPTPGQNTSESNMPIEENESYKIDDFDYGTIDDVTDFPDDEFRQED